jgi:hypothetical protein
MAKVILIIAMSIMLASCQTMALPSDATPQEKRVALCADALSSLQLAIIGIELAVSPESLTYWTRWMDGAQRGAALYCGGKQ